MNDSQRNCIAWFVIILLVCSYNFFITSKQKNIEVLLDKLKVLMNNNQARLERKISKFKNNLPANINDIKCQSLAKSLLVVAQVHNKLLKDIKFSDFYNCMSEVKLLTSELDNQDVRDAVHILEGIREIDTLKELNYSFEQVMSDLYYNQCTVFKKITSNWIKIRDKHDPLKTKWIEIENLINIGDWQNIDSVIKDLTYPEFKPWISKLRNFIIVLENVSILYNALLQYVS